MHACRSTLEDPTVHRLGRTTEEAAGTGCADCHEDPHGGQFDDSLGETDCQRCHDEARPEFLSFDHETDSRFPLGEAHASLACSACHLPMQRDGLTVLRFKPLGAECVDCHGSNAEVLLRRQSRNLPKRR